MLPPVRCGTGPAKVRSGQKLLNIVLQGHSILGGGGGVTLPFRPKTLIAAARPTAIVTDITVGGVDVIALRARVTSDMAPLYNASRRNIAILLETSDYIDDTRGEAAFGGDGLSLSDPAAAGAAYFAQVSGWVAQVRAAGFQAMVCTASSSYETTANPLSNNTQYLAGQDAAHALMRLNKSQYDLFADPAADPRLQDTSNTTYFDSGRIHLTDGASGGSSILSNIIIAGLPPG